MRARLRSGAPRARPRRDHVWLAASRRTRSARATSRPVSGASRRSRSSSPSARSCRGRCRTSARSRRSRTRTRATARRGSTLLRRRAVGRGGRRAADRAPTTTGRSASSGSSTARAARRRSPGDGCHAWAGGRTGDGYAAQGNILVSGATVDALAETFEATAGKVARRAAARLPRRGRGGGRRQPRPAVRRRCSSSSATAATPALSDTLVDLRVDDHADPLGELRRLYRLHDALFGQHAARRVAARRRRAARGARRAARARRARAPRVVGGRREPRGAGRRRGRDRSRRPRTTPGGNMSERYGSSRSTSSEAPSSRARRSGTRSARRSASRPSGSTPGRRPRTVSRSSASTTRRTRAPRATRSCTSYSTATRRSRSTARRSTAPTGTDRPRPGPRGEARSERHAAARRSSRSARSPARRSRRPAGSGRQRRSSFWPTEEWDRAIEVLEGHLAETPDSGGTHYNLACAHARAGRPRRRARPLTRAVELEDELRRVRPEGRRPRLASGRPALPCRNPSAPSPGSLRPPASSRKRRHGVVVGTRREDDRTRLGPRERADEQLDADREREGLVRAAARRTGTSSSGRAVPASTSPCVTAPIDTSATTGAPSDEGTAIAIGFVPVSGGPARRVRKALGDVAVTSATSPDRPAILRAHAPSTPVGKHDSQTTSLAPLGRVCVEPVADRGERQIAERAAPVPALESLACARGARARGGSSVSSSSPSSHGIARRARGPAFRPRPRRRGARRRSRAACSASTARGEPDARLVDRHVRCSAFERRFRFEDTGVSLTRSSQTL